MKTAIVLLCGLAVALASPVGSGSRIVGGRPAGIGEFPYQISFRNNNNHFCGGSILNANTILTAAHCVYQLPGVQGLTVVVGTNSLNAGGVAHPVAWFQTHQQWSPQNFFNDIAVVKLASQIQFNQNVQPISLSSGNPAPGQMLTLSGWGLTSYPGDIPNAMQAIDLRNLDLNTCAQRLQGAMPIGNGHVCTESPFGQGACQGDSGGPLVVNGQQVGVVSWGMPCAKGVPDVFTSVAFYLGWIQQYL